MSAPRGAGARRLGPSLLAAAALALGATGCAAAPQGAGAASAVVVSEGTDHGYSGAWLDEPYTKPALTFTDTSGRRVALARDTGAAVTLVFFGYTSCPDVCNTVLADAAMALKRADPATRAGTRLVFITTDPARDTPARMRDYLDGFDPRFVGLTAPLPVIEQAADALGVALTGTTKLPGGGYEVGHSAQLIGFGPDGKGRLVWVPDKITVGGLRQDVERLAASA